LDIFGRGLSALATVLLIRSLAVESFAFVVLFLTVGQFTASALTGGLRMRYTRVEAERVSRESAVPAGFASALGGSLLLVVAVGAMALVGATIVDASTSASEGKELVLLATPFTAAHSTIELVMQHHQAHLGFTRAGLLGAARGAAMLVVAVLAAAGALGSGIGVAAWLAGTFSLVAVLAAWPLLRASVRARSQEDHREGPLGFGSESGWLTVYYLASGGFAYASIFVIAALLDDVALASYGAATRYLAIVLGPMPALLAVLRVRTSQADIVDSGALQAGMLMRWMRVAGPPVVVVLAVVALLAPVVIPIVDGGRYPDSIPIFQLLLASALFTYATMPGPNLLMTQRRYRLLAALYAAALVVELAAGTIAAEIWGVIAVAAVTAVVGSVEISLVAWLAVRAGRRPSPYTP
jgi:O-antigen/teichoic acid export membrane protein